MAGRASLPTTRGGAPRRGAATPAAAGRERQGRFGFHLLYVPESRSRLKIAPTVFSVCGTFLVFRGRRPRSVRGKRGGHVMADPARPNVGFAGRRGRRLKPCGYGREAPRRGTRPRETRQAYNSGGVLVVDIVVANG